MKDKIWLNIEDSEYSKNGILYQNHILEQWKSYVDQAEKLSSRRNLTNVFFLTINTALIGSASLWIEKWIYNTHKPLIIFLLLTVLVMLLVWWILLKSYRNLNSSKMQIIRALEEKLPSSPYGLGEYNVLTKSKYISITVLEIFVPILFAVIYMVMLFYFLVWM